MMDGWTDDEVKTVFPLPLWFTMMVALIVVLPGCATAPLMPPAVPEHVVASFQAENTEGKLYDEPCRNAAVLEFLSDKIPAEVLATVKAASGTYQGHPYGVCWFWMGEGAAAMVVWDDGGYFAVPRAYLKFPLQV